MTHRLAIVALLSVAACTKPIVEAPVEAHVAPVGGVPTDSPPPDAPRDTSAMFPAGPGVTLMSDQFEAVIRDPRFRDLKQTFTTKVKIAEEILGQGEPFHEGSFDGFVWRGVTARTINAPFGCGEFILSSKGTPWATRPADSRACGLPYTLNPESQFTASGPKRTAFKLENVLGAHGLLPPADAAANAQVTLGASDFNENGERVWVGIAGRGRTAPITCRELHLGGRPRIEDVPLSRCGLSWPMPGMTFDPGPEVPPLDKDASLARCGCNASEVCMIDQRLPPNASMHTENDGWRARYRDGRAAKSQLATSCVPLPSGCSSATASCFFPPPSPGQPYAWNPAPCPAPGNTGHSFSATPSPHIMCYTRLGGPTRPANPILIPPPPPPPPHTSTAPKPVKTSTPSPSEIY